MKDRYRFVRLGVPVFTGLAWLSLSLQLFVGVALLLRGGPPVFVGDLDVPVRLIGLGNCVLAAIYFFVLNTIAQVLRLLLDQREGSA